MVLSSSIHTGTPWVLRWAASEHVLIEMEVFSCALKANAWKEFSVLSGSLYAEKRNQVDVGGGSGGTEVQNPMNTEGKHGIVEDWQGERRRMSDRERAGIETNRYAGGAGLCSWAVIFCILLNTRKKLRGPASLWCQTRHPGVLQKLADVGGRACYR